MKKKTTAEELAEMRETIAALKPGQVVTVDRELQERNTSLMLMLYGAAAKYGIGMRGDNGVIVTAQVPVIQVPANHSLEWEIAEDGRTVMLYIVLKEDSRDTAVAGVGATEETPPPAPEQIKTMIEAAGGEEALRGIADEFEDEIVVGLDDDLATEGGPSGD